MSIDLSLEQELSTFLAVCRTATLATADGAGVPRAACVQFVADAAWRLVWVSAQSSEHSRQLADRPQCAVSVYGHDDRPETIHGVQMHGEATLLDAAERAAAVELYRQKYPFVDDAPFDAALARGGVYRFTPRWLRWIDNRRGFGFKVEQRVG